MPDKLREITATIRVAWIDGSLKEVARVIAVVLAVVVGTIWAGWERVSQIWLSLFAVALIAYTLISPSPVVAGVSQDCAVSISYGNLWGGFSP